MERTSLTPRTSETDVTPRSQQYFYDDPKKIMIPQMAGGIAFMLSIYTVFTCHFVQGRQTYIGFPTPSNTKTKFGIGLFSRETPALNDPSCVYFQEDDFELLYDTQFFLAVTGNTLSCAVGCVTLLFSLFMWFCPCCTRRWSIAVQTTLYLMCFLFATFSQAVYWSEACNEDKCNINPDGSVGSLCFQSSCAVDKGSVVAGFAALAWLLTSYLTYRLRSQCLPSRLRKGSKRSWLRKNRSHSDTDLHYLGLEAACGNDMERNMGEGGDDEMSLDGILRLIEIANDGDNSLAVLGRKDTPTTAATQTPSSATCIDNESGDTNSETSERILSKNTYPPTLACGKIDDYSRDETVTIQTGDESSTQVIDAGEDTSRGLNGSSKISRLHMNETDINETEIEIGHQMAVSPLRPSKENKFKQEGSDSGDDTIDELTVHSSAARSGMVNVSATLLDAFYDVDEERQAVSNFSSTNSRNPAQQIIVPPQRTDKEVKFKQETSDSSDDECTIESSLSRKLKNNHREQTNISSNLLDAFYDVDEERQAALDPMTGTIGSKRASQHKEQERNSIPVSEGADNSDHSQTFSSDDYSTTSLIDQFLDEESVSGSISSPTNNNSNNNRFSNSNILDEVIEEINPPSYDTNVEQEDDSSTMISSSPHSP